MSGRDFVWVGLALVALALMWMAAVGGGGTLFGGLMGINEPPRPGSASTSPIEGFGMRELAMLGGFVATVVIVMGGYVGIRVLRSRSGEP